jgi:hypothetical protein
MAAAVDDVESVRELGVLNKPWDDPSKIQSRFDPLNPFHNNEKVTIVIVIIIVIRIMKNYTARSSKINEDRDHSSKIWQV